MDREPEPQRLHYLDALRGLAALQVLIHQFINAYYVELLSWRWPLAYLYDGSAAIYTFFVLSGYVLTKAFQPFAGQPIALALGRTVRLAIPAVSACLLAVLAWLLANGFRAETASILNNPWLKALWHPPDLPFAIKDIFVNSILLGYDGGSIFRLAPVTKAWLDPLAQAFNPPLWTLSTELHGSLLVLLLVWAGARDRRLWGVLLTVTTLLLFRSPFACFIVGHLAARFHLAERPGLLGAG